MGNKNLKEKIERDIRFTSGNYANMYNRLRRRNSITKFLIVYYSIVAVLNSIIPKFFVLEEITGIVLEFSSIVISIILLVASLAVSIANYSERELKVINAIDKLKKMKKHIQAEDELSKEDYTSYINEYHEIIDPMELRSNYDYYLTRKQNEKDTSITFWEQICFPVSHTIEMLAYAIVILLPIAIYISILLWHNKIV